jgi:hypothetical protein
VAGARPRPGGALRGRCGRLRGASSGSPPGCQGRTGRPRLGEDARHPDRFGGQAPGRRRAGISRPELGSRGAGLQPGRPGRLLAPGAALRRGRACRAAGGRQLRARSGRHARRASRPTASLDGTRLGARDPSRVRANESRPAARRRNAPRGGVAQCELRPALPIGACPRARDGGGRRRRVRDSLVRGGGRRLRRRSSPTRSSAKSSRSRTSCRFR